MYVARAMQQKSTLARQGIPQAYGNHVILCAPADGVRAVHIDAGQRWVLVHEARQQAALSFRKEA